LHIRNVMSAHTPSLTSVHPILKWLVDIMTSEGVG
jgi:hypothetical protein